MANGILVDQTGPVWVVTFSTSSVAHALPYTLCSFDLIPKRLHWTSVSGSAGDAVIITETTTTTPTVYHEVATGANYNAVEEKPHAREKWTGPIVITTFDSGELLISI